MLDQTRTRIDDTIEYELLSSVTVDHEGLCLQLALEDGRGKARPSNATADTQFIGVSWGERFAAPTTAVHIETVVVGANQKATLSKTPSAEADIMVIKGTSYLGGVLLANAGSPTNVQWDLDGDGVSIAVHADNIGATLFVVYRYNLTVLEAQMRFGDAYPGPRAMNTVKRVGVITKGHIWTDRFDVAVNWGAIDTIGSGEVIKGGANGMFTVTGNGCNTAGHVHVLEAPSVGSPWLGLYIDR